ncbi:MAG: hypothetical protein VYB65_02890 [Myxococcota bacterium]|nr:hypothetical protein [Myxococcota bacterium]
MRFRLTCAHGLEPLLADELADLGFTQPAVRAGSVLVTTEMSQLGRLHRSRIASRVWCLLVEGEPSHEADLLRQVGGVEWTRYRWTGDPLSVVVAGGRFDALDALRAAVDEHAPEGEGGTLLKVRCAPEWIGLELDCSGADMHQRGYRLDAQSAPLDENYASACLRAAGWTVGEALYDPFCGPGAFVIEAALMQRTSSRLRPWRFHQWPSPPADEAPPVDRGGEGLLMASDQAFEAFDSCRHHAQRAGVLDRISLHRKPLEDMDLSGLPSDGLVAAHPPYSDQLRGDVVRRLLARFHGALSGWRLALLLPADVGRPHGNLEDVLSFMHAGRRVTLWVGRP